MVKGRTFVWKYFNHIEIGNKVYGMCKFCEAKYVRHAGKMRNHLLKCKKCPEDVREQFKQQLEIFNQKVIAKESQGKDEVEDLNYFNVLTDTNASIRLHDEECTSEDQYDVFAKFVASEIRNLKSEQLQREVKKAISQIFMDVYLDENGAVVLD